LPAGMLTKNSYALPEMQMKAVVFRGIGDIRLEDVREPVIEQATDAIVRLTATAICGTDLHFVRGTVPGMESGTILGHEGVGVIETLGADVRNFKPGDRVLIPSTIACGSCAYCRAGYFAQCDNANPHGKRAGTAFFGGPADSGPFHGLQAEKARIPFAHVGLVKLPDEVSDDQAILISDIFPTGYFGAELAEITDGDTVAVFGCGPVGQFTIASAKLMGAARIFAIDHRADRLDMAQRQGAEVINFDVDQPVETILRLTDGIGADRAIDVVGVDAENSYASSAKGDNPGGSHGHEPNWIAGNAPSQTLDWAVECLAKAGTLGIIGVYPANARSFPIGTAMNKNLTLKMGNCNHRKYIPLLIEMVRSGQIDPLRVLTQVEPLTDAIEAYKAFDLRKPGWMKVTMKPEHAATEGSISSRVDCALEDTFPASDAVAKY
jgi:threonine dehydrogenase-like Zn-dependent dehydrogenase